MSRNGIFAVILALFCGCGASDGATTAPRASVGPPGSAGLSASGPGATSSGGITGGIATSPPPVTGASGRPGGGVGGLGAAGRTGISGMSGMAAAGATGGKAGTGAAGMAMTPPKVATSKDPTIPAIKGMCPSLETGSISFMGADGQVEAGAMPADATAPMLLYWHGTGSTAGEYAFMDADVAQGVTSQGGIIVSFQGSTGLGDCSPSGTAIFCTGDFDVMDQYVACGVMNRHVDPHRIFTAGCSAGGLMATAMAMDRSEYIAAAAPNSGGVTFGGMFSSDHTPPLMTIHGAPGSDVVGVDFSQTSATADMLFKQHGGFAIDCNTGGGHCGGAGLAPDAWTFFQAHPFGVAPEWTTLPAGFSSQCMIQ